MGQRNTLEIHSSSSQLIKGRKTGFGQWIEHLSHKHDILIDLTDYVRLPACTSSALREQAVCFCSPRSE